jgi:glycosyltransferase involved in cell wall biosynthesis
MIEQSEVDARDGTPAEQEHPAAGIAPRKRVLVLASTFPRWRDDTEPPFVYNLSRRLAERFEITVLAPHASRARRAERMEGMDVHRFRYFWPERAQQLAYGGMLPNLKRNRWLWAQVPFFLAAELIAAVRIVRTHKIDVIHAHWLVPQGLVAALAGLITRRPVVVTAHGADIYGLRGGVTSAIKRWVLRRMNRITAVSQHLAETVMELTPDRPVNVDVVSMGVDTERFHARRNAATLRRKLGVNGPLVLFVGRLAEKKGLRYLIDAMPGVLKQHPDATLVIVGDGPLRGELSLHARDLKLGESVRFLGARSPKDLPEFYSAADVFVGPSIIAEGGDTESFGLVFAEAMACGSPVIASDTGGVSDLVQHEKTGLLVPQRDPEAITMAVCRVLADKDLARRLRRNARAHVQRSFTQTAIAERYGSILQEAAA